MKIETCEDIFSRYPDLLVHPVNCVGVSHDIYSKQIKKTYPHYFKEYARACLRNHLKPAQPVVIELGALFGTNYIVILPIRNHWKESLRPDVTKEAILELCKVISEKNVATIAVPAIEGTPEGWLEAKLTEHLSQSRVKLLYLVK